MKTENEKTEPFVIERTYNATADKVWQAISDNEKMKQWYFDIEDFKPEVGFEFVFYGGTEEKSFKHICKVTEVVVGRKLAHTWRYDGYPGDSTVTWELFPEGDKTRVRLTHEGLETFPDMEEFKKENFAMGWTEITGKMLKEFVEEN
ncbi:SRPBCC domain-containing protein [Dyadobacter subterraneus]|uniref:SRPBCC domain-containing protein n=1 Tax=Dyadobacter subterraneus TaxID=2773304 RepID=A0ABR9WCM2_9BACT|nr:SRPBCC domain-containing protein [Dyadobacter subterraneus]MBE9463223.1 SRPBCC domain-containing protein [Dyadobacter subterraneus]